MSARKLAVELLNRTQDQNSYSNLVLDKALDESNFEDRDKALCALLYRGVTERRITLDYIISCYSKQPLRKLDTCVKNIIRIGLYQMLYCDHIPQHAAISESVKLTKQLRKASASGFVNAVLRNFQRADCQIQYPKDSTKAMEVRYSIQGWLWKKLVEKYGVESAEAFLENSLNPAPIYIRNNPNACTEAQLKEALGEKIEELSFPKGAFLWKGGDPAQTVPFFQGWFYVQDLSSQICSLSIGAKAGEKILDLCAAPGGKTCTIGHSIGNKGEIYSFDLTENRVHLIKQNVTRQGLTCVHPLVGDATVFCEAYGEADRVLCDVPCSGLGVIRRKPEIREKTEASLQELPQIQRSILENAAKYVKKGGVLQYSTCTILREENEAVIEGFLQDHPEFQLTPIVIGTETVSEEGMMTILPQRWNSDGFFIAKMIRKA